VGVLHIGKDLKHEDNINWPRKQHLQTSLKAGFRAIGRRRQHQIEALSRELAELELKAETVQKSESRLEPLIEEHMVRLDPDKKRLMDHFRLARRELQPETRLLHACRDFHPWAAIWSFVRHCLSRHPAAVEKIVARCADLFGKIFLV
jgi:hypothetical protein